MNTRIHRVKNKGGKAQSKNEKFQFKLRLANDVKMREEDGGSPKAKNDKEGKFQNLVYKTPRGIKLPKLNTKPKTREILQIQDNGLLVRFKKSKLSQGEKSNFFNLDTEERRKRFLNYNQKTLFKIKNRNFNRHSTDRLLASSSSKKIDYNFRAVNRKVSKSTKFDETLKRRYMQRQKLNVKFSDRKREKERKIDELVDYIQGKLMTFGEDIGDINDYIENVYNTKTEFRKQSREEDEQQAYTEQDYLKYLARRNSDENLEEERSYSKEKISDIIHSSRLLDAKLGSQGRIGIKRGKSLNDLKLNFENVYLTQKKHKYNNGSLKVKGGLVFHLPDNVHVTNKHLYDYYYTIHEEKEGGGLRGSSQREKRVKYPDSDLLDTSMLGSVSDLDNSGLMDPLKHFEMLGKMDEERLILKAIIEFRELERRRAINLRIKKELVPKVEERERRIEEERQHEIEVKRKRLREEMLKKKQRELNGTEESEIDKEKTAKLEEEKAETSPNLLKVKEKKKRRNSKKPKVVKKKPKKKIDRKRKKPKKTAYYSYWYNCICKMMKNEEIHLSEHEEVGYYSKCGIKASKPQPINIENLNFYNEKLYTEMFTLFSHTEKDLERDEKAHKCHPERERYEKLARRMSIGAFGISRSIAPGTTIAIPTLGIEKEEEYNKDIFASREAQSVFDIEYESVYG